MPKSKIQDLTPYSMIDKIAKQLSSIKTAVILLSLIILLSAIGTFIPQGLPPDEYIRRFNEPTYHLLRLFGFVNIYHSWWFIVLLILLWCSIFICTLKRLKFNPSISLRVDTERSGSIKPSTSLRVDTERSGSIKPSTSLRVDTERSRSIKPQTFPTIITHLGLLIILAGAFVTGILGEKGFMIIYEKHNQDTYIDADNKFKTLDFKIYLDDFSIDYYDDAKKQARPVRNYSAIGKEKEVSNRAGFIKDFRSKVVILGQDKEILKETIEVNRPLSYKGYSFYQASYDRDNFKWTGLDVVRDPGVPFVWCGFILLNLGVILRFYFRPKVEVV